MRPHQNTLPILLHQFAHVALIVLAFWAAYDTRLNLPYNLNSLTQNHDYSLDMLLCVVSCHFSLRFFGVYQSQSRRKISLTRTVLLAVQVIFLGLGLVVFVDYFLHNWSESRLLLVFFAGYGFLFLAAFEYLFSHLRASYLKSHRKNILVIGAWHRATDFIRTVMHKPVSGYHVVGCLELPEVAESVGTRVYESVKIIGTIDQLETILRDTAIDELIFSIPLKKIVNVHEYIFLAESMGINIRILPDFQIRAIRYYPQTASIQLDDFLDTPIMTLSSVPRKEVQLLIKSIFDYASAASALLVLAPLLTLIAMAIKFTSPGGVFFSQKRCGLNGRIFNIYKFRTMVADAEKIKATLEEKNEMDGPVFKIKNDPRITPVGRFLRTTSLDELPQLFNILKGEMSLVGPRPPIPAEVGQYKLWQRRRLSMKPGLTCIWQISGRNDISFERWMEMDLQYIDNWSLKLDFILILQTIKEVTTGKGR